MRFLKIVAILIGIFCLGTLCYFVIALLASGNISRMPSMVLIYMIVAFVLTILNLIYHYKSYHYYKKIVHKAMTKKLSRFFWASGITFNCLLLSLFGLGAYEIWRSLLYYSIGFNTQQIFTVTVILAFLLIGFLEISVLKKRMKTIREELETKEGIESIGNSNS